MCYQSIGIDILSSSIDMTHSSPEKIFQSDVFTFREEWHQSEKGILQEKN